MVHAGINSLEMLLKQQALRSHAHIKRWNICVAFEQPLSRSFSSQIDLQTSSNDVELLLLLYLKPLLPHSEGMLPHLRSTLLMTIPHYFVSILQNAPN
jgi:hypothetical protein